MPTLQAFTPPTASTMLRAPSNAEAVNNNNPHDAKAAAAAFEKAFVGEMLRQADIGLKSGDGPTDNAFAGFAVDAFADALVRQGHLGLAAPIEQALLTRTASVSGGEHP